MGQSDRPSLRIGNVVINVADMELMTGFWCGALGLTPEDLPGGEWRFLHGDRVDLLLQKATTPVTARDQMHLDLFALDVEGEIARLTGLGAVSIRHSPGRQADFVVLADPEGNEFCIVRKA